MNHRIIEAFRFISMLICIMYLLNFIIKKKRVRILKEDEELSITELWYTPMNCSIPDDISCYNELAEDDILEDIQEKVVLPNTIFFHEPSCCRNIPLRQACAVESAARLHAGRQVFVLFTKSLSHKQCYCGPLEEIYRLDNVKFARVNLSNYALETPLEKVFKESLASQEKRHHARVAEYLKFLTLYRYGGMVLDLDMIVMPLLGSSLPYWFVMEGDKKLGSAVISIAKDKLGNNLTNQFLSALANQAHCGELDSGRAMYEVLNHYCNTSDLSQMTLSNCGVHIFNSDMFYPVSQTTWQDYLKPVKAYARYAGYHILNSEKINKTISKDSLYAEIARIHCPTVYSKFIHEFVEKGS